MDGRVAVADVREAAEPLMIIQLLASGDCERIRDGLVDQPVNTASSVAYLIAGAAIAERARHASRHDRADSIALALATAANGVGSAAFHGVGGSWSRWPHDAAVLAVLGFVVVTNVDRLTAALRPHRVGTTRVVIAALIGAAGAVALWPRVSRSSQVALMIAAVAAEAALSVDHRRRGDRDPRRTRRSRRLLIGGGIAGALHATSRTGGPLCSPDSVLQGHAAWHLITALLLWWWAEPLLPRTRASTEAATG